MSEQPIKAVKVKLIYPHSIGDRIDIFGATFDRDGEHHYAVVSEDLAAEIVNGGNGEVVGEVTDG
jgi:hypothetical protein